MIIKFKVTICLDLIEKRNVLYFNFNQRRKEKGI